MTTTQDEPAGASTPPTGAGRIVVGVDGSPASIEALEWALKQAKLTGVGIDAVITWSIPASAASAGALPESFDPAGDAARALADAVAGVRAQHPDFDLRTIEVEGQPGPSLVDYAAGAELLVIASRGHGFVAGLLLSSVSEYCVSHAHCPVLVLRHPAANRS
jgi:nucleotide-binding universal stress UspA family protein